MTPRPLVVALLAVMLVAGLAAGCGGTTARPKAHGSTRSSASPSPSASPLADASAPASSPLGAGQRVWAAFTARGLSHHDWWARLAPLLSDSARATYVYDDPRNIPAMTMSGRLHLAPKPPAQPGFSAEVIAPTSKGVFRLDLERHTKGSAWLLYAIKFPPGVQ